MDMFFKAGWFLNLLLDSSSSSFFLVVKSLVEDSKNKKRLEHKIKLRSFSSVLNPSLKPNPKP